MSGVAESALGSARPTRVLFVCLGNICRSPTAEAVMRQLVDDAGAGHLVEVDSAGTGGWHVGDPPDRRARAEAARRGVTMDSRGRQVQRWDFDEFDLLVAMDRRNRADLHDLAPGPEHRQRVRLLREYDPERPASIDPADPDADPAGEHLDVPDPYYGEGDGFARVFDIVDRSCRALLDDLLDQDGGTVTDPDRR